MTITPLAPRTPYIVRSDASLRTRIDSMSYGLIPDSPPSADGENGTPSTMYSGALLPYIDDEPPRMRTVGLPSGARPITTPAERFEIGVEAGRLPAGCRYKGPIEERRLPIMQRHPVRPIDETSGREKYRVPGCRVPLACRRNSRVNVRLSLCDDAELERRPDRGIGARANGCLEIIHGRLVEMGLGRDCRHVPPSRTRADRLAPASLIEPRALPHASAVELTHRRSEDDAQRWRAVLDQADVHRVIVAASDEFLGSVERIYKEVHIAMRGNATRRDLLLGDHRNTRSCAGQRRQDDEFGYPVSLRDGR